MLGVALGPMVEAAVSNAVREVYANLEETKKCGRLEGSLSGLVDGAHSTYRQQTWPTTPTSHQRPSISTSAARQIRYARTVSLGFATISLQSKCTIIQEILFPHENERRVPETTRTSMKVNIRLHPRILRKGVLVSLEKQYLGGASLNADMRLRAYGIVSFWSPIAKACRSGNFTAAYRLFQSGQASVFDVVERSWFHNVTLLDYTWYYLEKSMRFRSYKTAVEPRVVDGLLEIFKFLATHGPDPGEQDGWQMSRLQQIF